MHLPPRDGALLVGIRRQPSALRKARSHGRAATHRSRAPPCTCEVEAVVSVVRMPCSRRKQREGTSAVRTRVHTQTRAPRERRQVQAFRRHRRQRPAWRGPLGRHLRRAQEEHRRGRLRPKGRLMHPTRPVRKHGKRPEQSNRVQTGGRTRLPTHLTSCHRGGSRSLSGRLRWTRPRRSCACASQSTVQWR